MPMRFQLAVRDPALWLFIGMGFLAGIYIAGMEVGTLTLFLNELDESRYLALAFLLTAILSITTINLFNQMQRGMSYYRLSWVVLLLLTISTLSLRLLFAWVDTPTQRTRLVFGSFVVGAVLVVFVNLIFWGTIYHYYNLKQQKRIIGNIDVGKSIAGVAAFFAIPLFSHYFPQTEDLIDIGVLMSFGILILYTVFLWLKREQIISTSSISQTSQEHWGIGFIFRHRYTRYMVGFIFLSVISYQLLDYTFLNSAGVLYPREKDLQNFIALFEGSTLLLAFLLQSFITDRLIEQYGIGITLMIAPALLLLFLTTGLIIEGFAPDWQQYSNTFLLFFMMLALSRMTLAALKESNEDTAFKFCYFPIPREARLSVLHQIDGNIRTGAGIVAGLLLLAFQYWQLSNLLLLTTGILLLSLLWLGSVFQLSKAYHLQLHRLLHKDTQEAAPIESTSNQYYQPPSYKFIEALCLHEAVYARQVAPVLFRMAPEISAAHLPLPPVVETTQEIREQRLWQLFSGNDSLTHNQLLMVVEAMDSPRHAHLAAALLCRAGERALPVLESFFVKAGQNDFLLCHILEVYARMGTPASLQLLYKYLHSTNPAIHRQAFHLIMAMDNPLHHDLQEYVYRLIDEEITDALWDLVALEVLAGSPVARPLRHALQAEIKENYETIFKALTALYDKEAVHTIRQNIEEEDIESQVLAIELLGTLLNEHLKKRLVPFFDTLPVNKKLEHLGEYYPIEPMPAQKVVETLIIRDYAYTTAWTRACAIRYIAQAGSTQNLAPLIANVFHTNRLIRESSFHALHALSAEQAAGVLQRLPAIHRQELQLLIRQNLPTLLDCGFSLQQSALFKDTAEEVIQEIVLYCERYRAEDSTFSFPKTGIWAVYSSQDGSNRAAANGHIFFALQEENIRLAPGSVLLYLPPAVVEYYAAYFPSLLTNYLRLRTQNKAAVSYNV